MHRAGRQKRDARSGAHRAPACSACRAPLGAALVCRHCGHIEPATLRHLADLLAAATDRQAAREIVCEALTHRARPLRETPVSAPHDLVVHFLQPAEPTYWLVVAFRSPGQSQPLVADVEHEVQVLQAQHIVALGLDVVADAQAASVVPVAGRLDDLTRQRILFDLPPCATLAAAVRDACADAVVPTLDELADDLRRAESAHAPGDGSDQHPGRGGAA